MDRFEWTIPMFSTSSRAHMKTKLLITINSAVLLVGCGETQQSEMKPEPPTAKAPRISIHDAANKEKLKPSSTWILERMWMRRIILSDRLLYKAWRTLLVLNLKNEWIWKKNDTDSNHVFDSRSIAKPRCSLTSGQVEAGCKAGNCMILYRS